MPDRVYRFRTEIDPGNSATQAHQLRQIFERELSQIKFSFAATNGGGAGGLAATIGEEQRRMTVIARGETQIRQQAARAEAQVLIESARTARVAATEEQRRLTASHRAEIRAREQAEREAARQAAGGGVGGILGQIPGLGALSGGLTVGAGILLGQQVGQQLIALDQEATAYKRVEAAALQMAGSQERLNQLLRAYTQAAGGAVTRGEALAKVSQLTSIGFADSAQELTRFVTAARGSSIARGADVDYIVGQMQLAIANQSTMRLDQLGVGVSELKAKQEELKRTMPELSDEMRFQEALLGVMIDKFGALTTSVEGQASGYERLTAKLRGYREEAALLTQPKTEATFNFLNTAIDRTASVTGLGRDPSILAPQLRQAAYVSGLPALGVSDRERETYAAAAGTLDRFTRAVDANVPGIEGLRGAVEEYGSAVYRGKYSTDEANISFIALNGALELLESRASSAGDAVAEASAIMAESAALAARMFSTDVTGQMYRNLGPGQAAIPVETYGPYLPGQGPQRTWTTLGGKSIRPTPEEQNAEQLKKDRDDARNAERLLNQQERSAREVQSAWERASKEVEKEWKSAAGKLKSMLENVPGLFSTSKVTDDDLQLAKWGIYQPKADEYLRQLEDEVRTGKDYAGVDLADAARRGGIDQSLPKEAQFALFADQWKTLRLFADEQGKPRNLDLLDYGAVQQSLNEQRQGEAGRSNLFNLFNLTPEGEFKDAKNAGFTISSYLGEGALEGIPSLAAAYAAELGTAFGNSESAGLLYDAGVTMKEGVMSGFLSDSESGSAGKAFVSIIVSEVLREVAEQGRP